jgi:opacity protein-like surface antigen
MLNAVAPLDHKTPGGQMTLSGKRLAALAVLVAGAAAPARAQSVVAVTETLDFDRPESWGMKYYASLALLTSMGAPQRRAGGQVALGFEGAYVPQMSDEQRRIGFNGTKLEDVNKTSFFGRIRGSVGLGNDFALELGYTPPVEIGGAKPNILAIGVGRPFQLSDTWRIGVRGYGQIGTIEGDITCSADEVAAGDDLQENPFQCVEPSEDESKQKVIGLELVAGYDGSSRFKPYVGVGVNYMDLEFHVNALYADGLVEDHNVQLTSGTTLSATAGVTYAAGERWRLTGELFYSWLTVLRPPSTASTNDGFFNGRFFVSYQVH